MLSEDTASSFIDKYFKQIYEYVSFGEGYWINANTGEVYELGGESSSGGYDAHEDFMQRNYELFDIPKQEPGDTYIYSQYDYPNVMENWIRARKGVTSGGKNEINFTIPNNASRSYLDIVIKFLMGLKLDKPPIIYWETYDTKLTGSDISYFDFLDARSWKSITD